MHIDPAWPWMIAVAVLTAIGYAALIRWMNDHPRYGQFWRAHAWVEVAAGNSLIMASLGLCCGWQVMALVFLANVVWGTPMIIGELWANAKREAERDEQKIAQGR